MTPDIRDDNRLFVALELPDEPRRHLAAVAQTLADELWGRAVPAENLHVTLSFLGRVDPTATAALAAELQASAPQEVIAARLSSLRARPQGRSRVVAAEIDLVSADNADKLDTLRTALGEVTGRVEEEQPLWLHVTLVRFRRPTTIANLPDMQWEQVFGIDRITLYDSHMRPSAPPHYERVTAVDLTTPAA